MKRFKPTDSKQQDPFKPAYRRASQAGEMMPEAVDTNQQDNKDAPPPFIKQEPLGPNEQQTNRFNNNNFNSNNPGGGPGGPVSNGPVGQNAGGPGDPFDYDDKNRENGSKVNISTFSTC